MNLIRSQAATAFPLRLLDSTISNKPEETLAASKAKWGRVAQSIDKHNGAISK